MIKERLHETSGKQRNWGKDEYKENKTDRKRGRKKRQESRLEEQSKDDERGGKKMKGIHSFSLQSEKEKKGTGPKIKSRRASEIDRGRRRERR